MARGIREKKRKRDFFFFNGTLCTNKTRLASGEGGKEEAAFSSHHPLSHFLTMAYWIPFFGKQTKAYLVAVKWNILNLGTTVDNNR
jgi:hypothetical protein